MSETRKSLSPDELYRRCDVDQFDFQTTDELDKLAVPLGQKRAADALEFGLNIRRDGYNVFALGPDITDKQRVVTDFLEAQAEKDETPSDWCYIFNFEHPYRPQILELPTGTGDEFAKDMEKFAEELQDALTAAFESEEYQTRRQVIEENFQEEHEGALEDLQKRAEERGLALLRTPSGFAFAPIKDGEVVSPREIQDLPEEEQERLEEAVQELQQDLQRILRQIPSEQRKLREQIRELNQEIAALAVDDLIEEIRQKYSDLEQVQEYLNDVEEDITQNVEDLVQAGRGGGPSNGLSQQIRRAQQLQQEQETLQRYKVNCLVEHEANDNAPVIFEDHPTLQNLIGRIEYRAQMGTLVTDFTLIKPGALHRANGGYLILDARKVLSQPGAWEALKRALRGGEIVIQSLREQMGFVSTVSLEPEPIPLDVKVVLLGDRWLYYLLEQLEPEFDQLFKVEADFDDQLDRSTENESKYARLIRSLVEQNELRPFDAAAVARVVEHGARTVGDAEKLSIGIRDLRDLLRESDYYAGKNSREIATSDDVEEALNARRRRSGRVRERIQENILRDTLYIDTDGTVTGQVNGLSVIQLGRGTFGRPNRITARVRLGKGDVIDIEREVELGGPIHSKGVMILSSFLGARYAEEKPLSLSASLVFEQSYGGIEGDSASAAELFALLSAIAEVPLRQSLAVTGSVNQHGAIQPIGGVNEKIEGFFEICDARGLTGDQGVLIPQSNVKHLMLRKEVREAVKNDAFHIYPLTHVDEGMELLTGKDMGERQDDGSYPEDTINQLVTQKLDYLAQQRLEFQTMTDETEE